MQKINIAIDGPAAAGKSTTARMLAGRLGFIYVDTGAMYRAVTWNVLQHRIPIEHTDRVIEIARQMDIALKPGLDGQQVFVDGRDVTALIRSAEINRNVSLVASIPEVREILVRRQKEMAAAKGVVMDGRDIGTHVLPDAEIKVFFTATTRERAIRRLKEMNDPTITLEQVEQDLIRRDQLDQQREASPLIQAKDAVLLDNTAMSHEEVVEAILSMCKTKVGGG